MRLQALHFLGLVRIRSLLPAALRVAARGPDAAVAAHRHGSHAGLLHRGAGGPAGQVFVPWILGEESYLRLLLVNNYNRTATGTTMTQKAYDLSGQGSCPKYEKPVES